MNKYNPLKTVIIINSLLTNLFLIFQNEKNKNEKKTYFKEILELIKEQKNELNEIQKIHYDCLLKLKNNHKKKEKTNENI